MNADDDSPAEATKQALLEQVHGAKSMLGHERQRAVQALEDLFRSGRPPNEPLAGPYDGEFLALQIVPGLTQLGELLAKIWMPWKGKWFNSGTQEGANVFWRHSLLLARMLWPLYRYYPQVGPETYHAFPFRAYLAPSREDPGHQVLRIDYDLEVNPRLSVRRVLDELVQLADGLYLGKAHLRWWWGAWQRVAFFTLSQKGPST